MIRQFEQEKLRPLRTEFTQKKAAILNDKQLTESGRAEQLRQLVGETNERINALKQEFRQSREDRKVSLTSQLWGVGFKFDTPESERQQKAEYYRNAVDRAEKARNKKELQTMMTKAQKINDHLAVKAISFVAQEKGLYDISRNGFEGDARNDFDELRSLQNPSSNEKFYENTAFTKATE